MPRHVENALAAMTGSGKQHKLPRKIKKGLKIALLHSLPLDGMLNPWKSKEVRIDRSERFYSFERIRGPRFKGRELRSYRLIS